MNIEDVDETQIPTPSVECDSLEQIFKRQEELRKKYGPIETAKNLLPPLSDESIGNLDLSLVQAHLKDFAWRLTEEIGEAMNCLKNKPWKQSEMATDSAHFYEELADAFHFFIEMCIIAGLDAKSLYMIYMKKSEVNKFRQRSKY